MQEGGETSTRWHQKNLSLKTSQKVGQSETQQEITESRLFWKKSQILRFFYFDSPTQNYQN